MERLNANIAFKGADSEEVGKIADLIVTGTKRLTQLYTKLIAEHSSSPPPPHSQSPTTQLSSTVGPLARPVVAPKFPPIERLSTMVSP
ncbi:hypothetical protein NMY22_g19328 [Coprinellus aureogranulatus]|nr:hypothetical protein NMY22_g19328 [Coprinellus aureogranulatus]